jgi:hypothetical protein
LGHSSSSNSAKGNSATRTTILKSASYVRRLSGAESTRVVFESTTVTIPLALRAAGRRSDTHTRTVRVRRFVAVCTRFVRANTNAPRRDASFLDCARQL